MPSTNPAPFATCHPSHRWVGRRCTYCTASAGDAAAVGPCVAVEVRPGGGLAFYFPPDGAAA